MEQFLPNLADGGQDRVRDHTGTSDQGTGIVAGHSVLRDGQRLPADMSAAGHNFLRAAQVQAGFAPDRAD